MTPSTHDSPGAGLNLIAIRNSAALVREHLTVADRQTFDLLMELVEAFPSDINSQGMDKTELCKKLQLSEGSEKVRASRLRKSLKELSTTMPDLDPYPVMPNATDPQTREYRLVWHARPKTAGEQVQAPTAGIFRQRSWVLATVLGGLVLMGGAALAWRSRTAEIPVAVPPPRPAVTVERFVVGVRRLEEDKAAKPKDGKLAIVPSKIPIIRRPVTFSIVDPATVKSSLRNGDRFQMTISGPVSGFVYIFAREVVRGGKAERARFLFGGDQQNNLLKAGEPMAIPGTQDDDVFTVERPRADLIGDQFIFIVSPEPLSTEILRLGEAFEKLCASSLVSRVDGAGEGKVYLKREGTPPGTPIVLGLTLLSEPESLKKAAQ